eukprot:572153-Prorocentrum_minimum.AAC.4
MDCNLSFRRRCRLFKIHVFLTKIFIERPRLRVLVYAFLIKATTLGLVARAGVGGGHHFPVHGRHGPVRTDADEPERHRGGRAGHVPHDGLAAGRGGGHLHHHPRRPVRRLLPPPRRELRAEPASIPQGAPAQKDEIAFDRNRSEGCIYLRSEKECSPIHL